MRRGISPVIATVILIAVTIAIALAVGAWVMGIWGGLGGGERLKISYARLYNDGTVELLVKNDGTAASKVVRIEVVGVGKCDVNIVIGAGESKELDCETGKPLTVGQMHVIKVFTEAGSEYTIERPVEPRG
ncbi:MAG: archaellin/type IV pilin N-terminal domain-containing protein [Acidilobaceae archaeon]